MLCLSGFQFHHSRVILEGVMRPFQSVYLTMQDDDMEEGEAEPGEMPSLKRPNPITWQTPPKKPRVAGGSDESPADTVGARQPKEAGSMSASRANSARPPQPSPTQGA